MNGAQNIQNKWMVRKLTDGFWWVLTPSGKQWRRCLFWFDAYDIANDNARGYHR